MGQKKQISQADFEKVNREIIVPLRELYGADITPYMCEALTEDLYHYDSETLKAGIEKIRRTSEYKPSLAAIIAACERSAPRHEHEQLKKFVNAEWRTFEREAEMVMLSDFGQTGISEGWAASLYAKTLTTGKTNWSSSDVNDFRCEQNRAKSAINQVERAISLSNSPEERAELGIDMDKAVALSLKRLFEATLVKESALAKKYGKNSF